MDQWVTLGQVAKPHGLEGGFYVKNGALEDSGLAYMETLFLGKSPNTSREFKKAWAHFGPKGWRLGLEGVQSRQDAAGLTHLDIFCKRSALKSLSPNQFYYSDLIGCDVYCQSEPNQVWGILTAVEPSAGADRLWIQTKSGESVPIPALKTWITHIDIEARKMMIHPQGVILK